VPETENEEMLNFFFDLRKSYYDCLIGKNKTNVECLFIIFVLRLWYYFRET